MEQLIVKVQVSLASNMPGKRVLIYTEDRTTVCMEGPADPMILAIMKDRPKVFHYGAFENGVFTLKGEAPWQDW
jgi:hypothetical protein